MLRVLLLYLALLLLLGHATCSDEVESGTNATIDGPYAADEAPLDVEQHRGGRPRGPLRGVVLGTRKVLENTGKGIGKTLKVCTSSRPNRM